MDFWSGVDFWSLIEFTIVWCRGDLGAIQLKCFAFSAANSIRRDGVVVRLAEFRWVRADRMLSVVPSKKREKTLRN